MIFFFSGLLVGYISWGHELWFASLSISLFFVYFLAQKRVEVFVFAWGYYLAASRGLLIGTIHYYDDKVLYGFSVWLGASFISSLVWGLLWSNNAIKRYLLFIAVQLILILPPIGLVSWVNPMITSGLFFKGLGFLGWVCLLSYIYMVVYLFSYHKYVSIGMILLGYGSLYFVDHSVKQDTDFYSLNSHFDYGINEFDYFSSYQRQRKYVQQVNELPFTDIVLPENALGFMDAHTQLIWKNLEHNKTIFSGVHIRDSINNQKYDNALIKLSHNGNQILYRQRIPVPIAMWHFWEDKGANAYITGPSYFRHKGKKIGTLICYEQLVIYPYMQIFLNQPDSLLGVSNLWWAKGTSIKRIEEENMQLWSLLFDVPMRFVWNE